MTHRETERAQRPDDEAAPGPRVVALSDRPTLSDIEGQLRQIADLVASGKLGSVRAVAVVVEAEGRGPATFGAGDADPLRQLGLFSLAVTQLGCIHLGGAVRRQR